MIRRNRIATWATAAAAMSAMALVFAAGALAQSPTDAQYDETITRNGGPSELAFTGLDVVMFAGIGLALLAAGLVVRKMTRTRHDLR